jgi:hypothetical protein
MRSQNATNNIGNTVIHLSVPAGTYKTMTQAKNEANALKKYIQYHFGIKGYVYKILIYVSNIKPSKAEYVCVPDGKGRPPREVDPYESEIDEAFVEPHLHILVIARKYAATLANAVIGYLMKRHESDKCNSYRLHVYKKYATTPEKLKKYVTKQAKNVVTVRPLAKKKIYDSFLLDLNEYIAILSCLQKIADEMTLYEKVWQMQQFKNYIWSVAVMHMNFYNSAYDEHSELNHVMQMYNYLDYIFREVESWRKAILRSEENYLIAKEEMRHFCGEN